MGFPIREILEHKQVGFWTFIIGLIFSVLLFAYDKREAEPRLSIIQGRPIDVLDLRRQLPNLVVVFENRNVLEEGLNLTVYRFSFSNSGSSSITKSLFDDADPVGLDLLNGTIVATPNVESSSPYLKSNLALQVFDATHVRFRPVILDPGESFSFEVIVIHEVGKSPAFSVAGKIAGVRRLEISVDNSSPDQISFFRRSFSGDAGVQAVRAVGYFFVFVGSLGLLIWSLVTANSVVEKLQKYRRSQQFQKISAGLHNVRFGYMSLLRDVFEERGRGGIETLSQVLLNRERLQEVARWHATEKRLEDAAGLNKKRSSPAGKAEEMVQDALEANRKTSVELATLRLAQEFETFVPSLVERNFKKLVDIGAIKVADDFVEVEPEFAEAIEVVGKALLAIT